MSSRRVIVLVIFCSIVAFCSGLGLGFFQGLWAYNVLDSTPRAALAVANLHALEKGNEKPVKLLLESQVDSALGFYPYMQEQWWYGLFESGWLLVDPNDYPNYIERAATYRKTHVSPLRGCASTPAGEPLTEAHKQMYVEIKEHQDREDATVAKYAK
ncbi:hypothetical protein [Azospira oryzae]|uniref:hypothetical protein n=1 Tax=Azospira oryzae TaxID=146939 RepID=UPI0012FEAD52|nr:hypothetical protein [Azospira oryzae]